MQQLRSLLARVLALVLPFYLVPPAVAANPSIGVLTLATHAHLEGAVAFPGLSVFEGERLSTEAEGRLGIRAGHSVLTLGEQTEVWLNPLNGGLHVDMSQGSLHFASADHERVEIHVAEAIVSPTNTQASQGSVTLLGPKILQITAERGDLNSSFQGEFRTLRLRYGRDRPIVFVLMVRAEAHPMAPRPARWPRQPGGALVGSLTSSSARELQA